MRFKRDYLSALRKVFAWFISRFKPLTVHTEAIMVDEVWEKIKENVKKGNVKKWYVTTPINKSYFESSFNIKTSEKELSKKMIERYRWMIENNQKLELHIHLSMIMNLSYNEQEKIFDKAINWMKKNLGINPKEFVPGWWIYNKDTLSILKIKRIKLIKPIHYDYCHDYEWFNF
jgi:hypothetical protein